MTSNHQIKNTSLPVVWHIGRRGEVAGGMTQVVNGYLNWQFDQSKVEVIVTRDGSKWWNAIRVFFSGVALFFKVRDVNSNMFVVHLSQGGSFIREGCLLILASLRGFGTVAHIHGSRFVEFANRFPFLVRFVLGYASKVIVLSNATLEKVSQLIPADKVMLVPNAVPTGIGAAKEKLIVFGGSVSYRKGVDVLVNAWSKIDDKNGWQLQIAGPIADSDIVPDHLEAAEFLGSVNHGKLMQMLERSSVAILPSRDEAMPMFILEALARDNCVISTRVGGIPALLADHRGILVDAGHIQQLTLAISEVIHNDDYRQKIAQAGRLSFDQSFSAETIYPRVEKLWLSVIPRV